MEILEFVTIVTREVIVPETVVELAENIHVPLENILVKVGCPATHVM